MMNNKGFTLIELLAVLVILTAIMGIAIPTISSSMERTKSKQDENKKRVLEATAEIYVTDHKQAVYNLMGSNSYVIIGIDELREYLPDDAFEDSKGDDFSGCIKFTKPNTYKYMESDCS